MNPDDFTIDCTGDVVTGDTIFWTEAVFGGNYRKPKYLGERRVIAQVVADSYGAAKQQHTFSVEVLWSDGEQPLKVGTRTRRKGRNIYREWTMRRVWDDESARRSAADEKHRRGSVARTRREERRL